MVRESERFVSEFVLAQNPTPFARYEKMYNW